MLCLRQCLKNITNSNSNLEYAHNSCSMSKIIHRVNNFRKVFNVNKVNLHFSRHFGTNFAKYATRTNQTNKKKKLTTETLFNFTLVHSLTTNSIILQPSKSYISHDSDWRFIAKLEILHWTLQYAWEIMKLLRTGTGKETAYKDLILLETATTKFRQDNIN